MKYDFTALPQAFRPYSVKWRIMNEACPHIGPDAIPLSVADMEFSTPPEIAQGLRDIVEDPAFAFGYPADDDDYYAALTGWMLRRHQWSIERAWVVPTPGIVPALGVAVGAYTQPGDGVIIMEPVYPPFANAIQTRGRRVVSSPLLLGEDGRYTICFDDLEKKAAQPDNKLLILCSPHNPVSRVWTREELRQVGDICLKHGVLVVSDEIHFDILLPGHTHTVYATLGEAFAQNCIICTAPSKTFNLAGLKCSNLIIPNPALKQRYLDEQTACSFPSGLNVLAYRALVLAYTQAEGWLDAFLSVLDENYRFCQAFVRQRLPMLHISPMEGTYLLWLDCRELGLSAPDLEIFLHEKAHLFLNEGSVFGQGGDGFERINLACPLQVLEESFARLEKAIKGR